MLLQSIDIEIGILSKKNLYVKTSNVKDENKLMPFHKDDGKLLEKSITSWTMIEH